MTKDDTVYIELILDSINKIRTYMADMSYEEFCADGKTQSAVIMQLEVMGELAKKVSGETRQRYDVPWKEMAGLRDLVAHQYFSLDLDVIYKTAMESVGEVERVLEG